MRQQVTSEFVAVSVSAGTLQNVSKFRNIEVASTQEKGTGVILKPLDRIQFLEDVTVYVRTFGNDIDVNGRAYFITEPFKLRTGRKNMPTEFRERVNIMRINLLYNTICDNTCKIDNNGQLVFLYAQ